MMFSRFGRLLQVVDPINKVVKYEMGYTPKEFKKTLHGLFLSQTPYSCEELAPSNWQVTVENEVTTVDIKIKEAPPRVIALLTLPVLDVSFQFLKGSEEQQKVFMKTFFRYFHKGGG